MTLFICLKSSRVSFFHKLRKDFEMVPNQLCFSINGKQPGSCHDAFLLGTNDARGEHQYLSDVKSAAQHYHSYKNTLRMGAVCYELTTNVTTVAKKTCPSYRTRSAEQRNTLAQTQCHQTLDKSWKKNTDVLSRLFLQHKHTRLRLLHQR